MFDLGRLLAVLTSINVKCKPSKTSIAQRECILFGYKLDENGYTIDPKRLDSMLLIPKPSTRKQLIKVLGQASYYRSLLPPQTPMGYFTSHFRDLTSEKNPFEWTNEHDRVWDNFKSALRKNLTLQRLKDSDDSVIVRTDASQSHFGGTISAIRNEREILLYTMSRAWSPTVSRYHISRLELISCLTVLAEFKMDLIGRDVTVYVDNASVYFLLSNPERITIEGTLLPKLFYEIRHVIFKVKKTDNKDEKWALVDALSRTSSQIRIVSRNVKELLTIEDDPEPEHCTLLADLIVKPLDIHNMKVFAPLIRLKGFEEMKQNIERDPRYRANKIVPEEFRLEILKHSHCLGHLGIVKMATFLTNNDLFWKGRN